jgi:type I restriction enzyme R subunit
MVKRVFMSENPPPVDQFDCIIVDEAHRGYTLDQDITEGELATRDASQYLSTYRRVLDYFDAIKIGLTATPAKHTSEVFGKPVYTYSYREAVADDWLIDQEPPLRYKTLLTQKGIQFEKGAVVSSINIGTGEVETDELEDDIRKFELSAHIVRKIMVRLIQPDCPQGANRGQSEGHCKVKAVSRSFCIQKPSSDQSESFLPSARLSSK